MTESELLADLIQRSKTLVSNTLGDFSDTEMLHRPCPTANHAAWQLGHVTESLHAKIGQFSPSAASASARRFTKATASSNDAAYFGAKVHMLADYQAAMDKATEVVRRASADDLSKASAGPMAGFMPTLGHVAAIMSTHSVMHVGQFQVIRRSLGKPVLF